MAQTSRLPRQRFESPQPCRKNVRGDVFVFVSGKYANAETHTWIERNTRVGKIDIDESTTTTVETGGEGDIQLGVGRWCSKVGRHPPVASMLLVETKIHQEGKSVKSPCEPSISNDPPPTIDNR